MGDRTSLGAIVLAVAGLATAVTGARALDPADAKYPDIRGAWERPGAAQWDPTKPGGLRQQAPLTPQYQAVFEANLADATKPAGRATIRRSSACPRACRG